MWGDIRFKISLSQILEKKGKRLIGLYEPGDSGGSFGLTNITMCENFHRIGKYDCLCIALNIYVKSIIAFLGKHLETSEVIKSKPGDFLFEYFKIAFWIH